MDPRAGNARAADPYPTGAWTTEPDPSGTWTAEPHPSGAWTTDTGTWTTGPRAAGPAGDRYGSGTWPRPSGSPRDQDARPGGSGEPARRGARHRSQPEAGARRGSRGREPAGGPAAPRPGPPRPPDLSHGTVLRWMAIWYLVPLALFLGWALTRSPAPDPGCRGAIGTACPSGRTEALDLLVTSVPQILAAVTLSVLAGLALRRVNHTWRPAVVAIAAAVVGAALATVLGPLLSGGAAG